MQEKYYADGVHVKRIEQPADTTVVRCQTLREALSLAWLLNAYHSANEGQRSVSDVLRDQLRALDVQPTA